MKYFLILYICLLSHTASAFTSQMIQSSLEKSSPQTKKTLESKCKKGNKNACLSVKCLKKDTASCDVLAGKTIKILSFAATLNPTAEESSAIFKGDRSKIRLFLNKKKPSIVKSCKNGNESACEIIDLMKEEAI